VSESACPHCGGDLPYIPQTLRGKTLPVDVVRQLYALQAHPQQANWYLRQLHEVAGYSLRTLGGPLGITGEAVRMRIKRARPVPGAPVVHPPQPPPPPPPPPPPIVNDQVAAELAALQEKATRLRAHPPGHPYRVASEQLARRLAELHDDGATYSELGAAIGLTKSAIRARLQHHGYRRLPPSQRGYENAAGPFAASNGVPVEAS